jgi:hypothetical protein
VQWHKNKKLEEKNGFYIYHISLNLLATAEG